MSAAPASARRINLVDWILPLIIVLIVIGMGVLEPRFFNRLNVYDILRNFSRTALLALAQALVMIVGGFDLSLGAVMAAASITSASVMLAAGIPLAGMSALIVLTGFAAAIIMGLAVGLVNGLLADRLKASPFIITLGTMTIISGFTFWYTHGSPIYGLPNVLVRAIGRGRIVGEPVIFWFGIAVIALLWAMATQTRFGRHMYAVGANAAAARDSGINQMKVLMLVYGLSGALAALAGLMLTAQLGSGQAGIANNAAIASIAAAVIGGVSLRGGIGSVPRVAMAALFLALMDNTLNLLQIDSKLQTLVLGVFLIGFVALERRLDSNA